MPTPLDGNPLNTASAIAVEMEKLVSRLYQQFMADDDMLSRIGTRNDLKVSARLCRMPVAMQPGSTFSQFSPDSSTSLGTGGGEQMDVGVATPAYFVQSNSVTKEAEWTAASDVQAITNAYKNQFKAGLRDMKANITRLLSASTGAGDLGTVTATPNSADTFLHVSDANNFQAGCQYQVLSAIGGSNRGNILVLSVDSASNIVYLSLLSAAYWPTGTVSGDTLIIAGASGAATASYTPDRYTSATIAASLIGVPGLVYSSASGDWFGIPRSTWPGLLNSAHVSGGGSSALTPQQLQLVESLVMRNTGTDADALEGLTAHANVDQITNWENVGLYTTTGIATAFTNKSGAGEGGDARPDFLNKNRVKTLAGREFLLNLYALPSRVDLVNLKRIFKVEVLPIQPFNSDGITAFPQRASDGGVAPITLFYFVCGLQTMTESARAHAYIDGLTVPSGF